LLAFILKSFKDNQLTSDDDLARIAVLQNAVYVKRERVSFANTWAEDAAVANIDLNSNGGAGAVSAETLPLDVVIAGAQLPFVDVIKLDVEGFELFGLLSLNHALSEGIVRNIIVEFGYAPFVCLFSGTRKLVAHTPIL
jgi:FkbM family methyltransferase